VSRNGVFSELRVGKRPKVQFPTIATALCPERKKSPRFVIQGFYMGRRRDRDEGEGHVLLDESRLMNIEQDGSRDTHESSYYAEVFLIGTTHDACGRHITSPRMPISTRNALAAASAV
jgi:hypothetical protein